MAACGRGAGRAAPWPILAWWPLLALWLPGPAAGESGSSKRREPDWRSLEETIRREMVVWGVPGLAIAVVEADRVLFLRAFGVREAGKPAPFEPDTVMPIGSTTKAMTATLVGMLVDEGKLEWDDPVTRHLPWFQLSDPWVTRAVTLRDLIAHRVGLGGALLPALTAFDRDEVLRRFRFLEPYAPFRARYDYSNVMVTAAGQVVAASTGTTWERALKERLLDPAAMTGAQLRVDELWDPADVAPCFCCDLPDRPVGLERARGGANLAMPHLAAEDGSRVIPYRRYASVGPAGGELAASIRDLARWARLVAGGGTLDGRRFLRPETFNEMHTAQMPMPDAARPPYLLDEPDVHVMAYGLGWQLNDYRGRAVSMHTGNVYGFMAAVAVLRGEGIGVAVLANSDRTGLVPALVYTVFDSYLGGPGRDWSRRVRERYRKDEADDRAEEERLRAGRKAGTRPPLALADYAGRYADRAYGDVSLTVEDDGLVLRFPGAQVADLDHWHHDLFRLSLRGPMAYPRFVRFEIDPGGEVARMNVEGVARFERRRP